MGVAPSFPFDDELRRIALAQALRTLSPDKAACRVARLLAYATAGLCPVDEADDLDALRRHRVRPVNRIPPFVNPIAGSVNLGEAA